MEKTESGRNQVIIDTDLPVDVLRGLEKAVTFIAELENKDLSFQRPSSMLSNCTMEPISLRKGAEPACRVFQFEY